MERRWMLTPHLHSSHTPVTRSYRSFLLNLSSECSILSVPTATAFAQASSSLAGQFRQTPITSLPPSLLHPVQSPRRGRAIFFNIQI